MSRIDDIASFCDLILYCNLSLPIANAAWRLLESSVVFKWGAVDAEDALGELSLD